MTTNPATKVDPNILALLYSKIKGPGGGLAEFAPGSQASGVDPNLGAALVAMGYMPKHYDMGGRLLMPGQQQGGSGLDGQTFAGLDALHANQPRGIPGSPFGIDGGTYGRVGRDAPLEYGPSYAPGGQGPMQHAMRPVDMTPGPNEQMPAYHPAQPPVPQGNPLPDYRGLNPAMFSPSNSATYGQIGQMPNRPQAPMPQFDQLPQGPPQQAGPPVPQIAPPRPQLPTGLLPSGPAMPQVGYTPQLPMGGPEGIGGVIGGPLGQQDQLAREERKKLFRAVLERRANPGVVSNLLRPVPPKALRSPFDLFQNPLKGAKSAKGRSY